jgi:hypothetical protein
MTVRTVMFNVPRTIVRGAHLPPVGERRAGREKKVVRPEIVVPRRRALRVLVKNARWNVFASGVAKSWSALSASGSQHLISVSSAFPHLHR